MRLFPLLAVAAVAFAGCSGGDPADTEAGEDDATGAGPHGTHETGTHLLAPTWEVGQWWSMSSELGDSRFVVAGEQGDDWIVATDNPDTAFFDAQSDISFLGPVRKSDLAGSQGSDRVEYFRFPLAADQQWTTRWDGLDLTVEVTRVQDGVASLEARRGDGGLHASYTYEDRLGYFGRIAFHGDDGAVAFEQRVASSGKDYGGDLVRYTLQAYYERHGPFDGGSTSTFRIGPGLTDVHLQVALSCQSGAFSVHVGELAGIPEERGLSASGPCPANVTDTTVLAAPTEEETWGAALMPAPATQATLDIVLLGRTLQTFKVGAVPG